VWDLYRALREHVVYVHVKDYRRVADTEAGSEGVAACFPGEGEGYVAEIVQDLLQTGYAGGFSIEPHITSVIHLDQQADDPELAYRTYVEYGRRLEELLEASGAA
jgi:sugar phosphate isomerase/epimerase